jgi:hypothetical protein
LPDRDVTADVHAIAHLMRGTGNQAPPPAPMPDLNRLSDAQFVEFMRSAYGIDSRLA